MEQPPEGDLGERQSVSPLVRGVGALRRRVFGLGFGLRLFLVLAAALAVVGVVGYSLISSRVEAYQVDSYAQIQRADAKGFELAARTEGKRAALKKISGLLDAIGRRPGTLEALLIDKDNVVRASGAKGDVGTRDSDSRINAALKLGRSHAGHEADTTLDTADYEFVTPVDFPDGRYAFETSFDHVNFAGQLAGVRHVLWMVGLFALFGVTGLFYLLGGRSLLRTHELALERATRDGLTDLPNHRAFQDEFGQAVAAATRHPDPLTLALVDLDHFKLVNDRHGHPKGDALLRRVAALLHDGRAADRAYRLGGDEFALLLPHTEVEGARILIHRLIRTLREHDAAASVGVATLRVGQTADELRAEADAALYEAKRRGGKGFVQFEQIRDRVAVTTAAKRDAVRDLVEDERVTTAYQPIWNLADGTLLGVEALARPHGSLGFSGPAEAFHVAEEMGLVHELDELCVATALQIVPELPPDVLLFLNLAPKTLELDAEGDSWFERLIEASDLEPGRVVVEVTERIGSRTPPVVRSLQRLRDAGFKLALDDVGTGNAGLEMLRQVDPEFVKVDRSIVAAALTEPNARAVLMAMATFALQTGAFVIAEGIEDEETLGFLRGIEELDLRRGTIIQGGQGFELGRPSAELPVAAGLAAQLL